MEIAGRYNYGDKVRLLQDVKSYFKKGKVYGKRNDIVTVFGYSEPVLFVEDKKGEKFPVHIEAVIKHFKNG